MKEILITGGAGFIGSHLTEKLINRGDKVYCLDNLFTGSIDNLKHLKNNKLFEFINHDITKPIDLKVDEIWNLACPASPIHYQFDPVKTIKTSVLGSINILELAKKNKCKVFLSSTSEVYGDPKIHPQVENYWGNVNPIGIRSCYDEGKRCAETLFFDYHRQFDLEIKIVRIFNTFGPRMLPNDGRVVSNFVVQSINNKPITIYGDGKQTRSFCYIDDLINGFLLFMDTSSIHKGPINLGNPEEITISELAKLILQLTNSKSEIIYLSLPQDDPMKRKPDITLAINTINWKPVESFHEGLKKTIAYFNKII